LPGCRRPASLITNIRFYTSTRNAEFGFKRVVKR
jgi:hypothetical protein